MGAQLLNLDDDVLTAIVAHLDCASARRLSFTARGIHIIATYRALQSVTLQSYESVAAFLKYMLGRMSHRVSALQKLELLCKLLSPSELRLLEIESGELKEQYSGIAVLLTDLFRGAISLRVLVMASAESWMAYDPRMVNALCSLQALRVIDIKLLGERTSKFINNMSSAPRKLVFRYGSLVQPIHGALVLEPHFSLRSVTALVADNLDTLPSPKDLARAFPYSVALDFMRIRATQPEAWRRTVRVSWPSVEHLRGSVSCFEDWATITPVHLVELVDQLSCRDYPLPLLRPQALNDEWKTTRACSAANTVVANFQPAVLVVQLDVSINIEHLERLVTNSTRLRYLAILIDDSHRQAGIGSWWHTMCSALAESSVICLELRILCGASAVWPSQYRDGRGFHTLVDAYKKAFMGVLESSAPDTPDTLRFLSLDCSPAEGKSSWRHDFLSSERSEKAGTVLDLRWWVLSGKGPARVAEVLEVVRGERIAAYIRSAQYDENQLDGLS